MRGYSDRIKDIPRRGSGGLPSSRLLGRMRLEEIHYPHLVQLWKPERIKVIADAERNPTGLAVADGKYIQVSEATPCMCISTPETEQPLIMGRTKYDNLFTLDKFLFPSGVEIRDAWTFIVLTPGDNQGDINIVQGNPQSSSATPGHTVGVQLVYAKRSPILLDGMVMPELQGAV